MKPENVLDGLGTALTPGLTQMGVDLSIHGDEDDALERLGLAEDKARLCLVMESLEMSPEEVEQDAGIAKMTFRALLQTPQGMPEVKAATEITGRLDSNVSLLTLAGWVRTLIQRVIFTEQDDFDNSFGFRFLTQRRYAPDGQRGLRSQELRFMCIISLDMPDGFPLEVPA